MSAIILCHLGESTPHYLKDCVHQIRIFNPDIQVYLIIEPIHLSSRFFTELNVILVSTDTLIETEYHTFFRNNIITDSFRNGYSRHVRERFYYFEELIVRENLKHVVCMEYDVLLYASIGHLYKKLEDDPKQTIRIVMDNPVRGHPGFMTIPSGEHMRNFNTFITSIIAQANQIDDMTLLSLYKKLCPNNINCLPCFSIKSDNKPRKSMNGLYGCEDSGFLSEDLEYFNCLFDSAVVGQYIGGIDSRNSGGKKETGFINETAMYSFNEMNFEWKRGEKGWQPYLDGIPLITIHMHSKALESFLSDRETQPTDDYDVEKIFSMLYPN